MKKIMTFGLVVLLVTGIVFGFSTTYQPASAIRNTQVSQVKADLVKDKEAIALSEVSPTLVPSNNWLFEWLKRIDLDANEEIGSGDLGYVLSAMNNNKKKADLNFDGTVNRNDVYVLQGFWGMSY